MWVCWQLWFPTILKSQLVCGLHIGSRCQIHPTGLSCAMNSSWFHPNFGGSDWMVGRRLRGKQSVEPSRPIDRNGWCLSQILGIFEWLVEYLGLQIFRLLPVAKNCRELLDTNQSNMWTRLLKDKICFNHFRAPDVMCQALSSRIPADLHNLSVCNGTCAIQRASKRSIANSWRLVVDWVRPSLKKLEMEFGQGVLSMSPQKLFF